MRIGKFFIRQGARHFGDADVLFSTSRRRNDLPTKYDKKIPNSHEKGQIAILVALATLTMMLVFASVINVGLLVHAKINLQNAADLAAASGAAQQARILTEVGRKNFELRQNYKEFLYLNWVLHNRDNYWYKRDSSEHPPVFCLEKEINEKLGRDGQGKYMNLCGNEKFLKENPARIKIHHNLFAISPASLIAEIFTTRIDQQFRNQFKDIGDVNRKHAEKDRDIYLKNSYFLWGNYLKPFEGQMNAPATVPSANLEKLWRFKATDIQATIPLPPRFQGIHALAQATAERNFTTLNQNARLIPLTPANGEYLRLNKLARSFKIWWADFQFDPTHGKITRSAKEVAINDFILGAKKDEGVLTYYAVKLVSQPVLPFMPAMMAKALKEDTLKLVAYAAAKPFGSRIGPQGEDPGYPRAGHNDVPPNISFYAGDRQGFYNPAIRRAIEQQISTEEHDQTSGTGPSREAIEMARFPSSFEAGSYLVGPEEMRWKPRWGNAANLNFFATNPRGLLNSWGPEGNARMGYSVKLIPIEEILRAGNAPANVEELRRIRH